MQLIIEVKFRFATSALKNYNKRNNEIYFRYIVICFCLILFLKTFFITNKFRLKSINIKNVVDNI